MVAPTETNTGSARTHADKIGELLQEKGFAHVSQRAGGFEVLLIRKTRTVAVLTVAEREAIARSLDEFGYVRTVHLPGLHFTFDED